MAGVRDPAFWHRFSVAVHQDEAARRPELKHSYVSAHPNPTPTPSTELSSTKPPISPTISSNPPKPSKPIRTPSTLKKPPPSKLSPSHSPSHSRHPSLPTQKPKHKSPYTHHRQTTHSLLSLTGRPPSRFKFWTHVEANPAHRESWLERQQAKQSRRTCLCWIFWLVFAGIVAGVVVVILWLKGRGII